MRLSYTLFECSHPIIKIKKKGNMNQMKKKEKGPSKKVEKISILGAIITGILLAFLVFYFCVPRSKNAKIEERVNKTNNVVNVAPLTEEQKEKFEINSMYYEKMLQDRNVVIENHSELIKLKDFVDLKESFWERKYKEPSQNKLAKKLTKSMNDNKIADEKKVKKYYAFKTGYITDVVNVRKKPSKKSKSLGLLLWNDEVTYRIYNRKWARICYDGGFAYVSLKYITKKPFAYEEYDTVREHQKSYMDYRKITLTSSKQYKLETSGYAYTGNHGIRMINGRYLCAIGTYYSDDVGRYVDLVLENGTIIPCILGDIKADKDTDSTNRYTVHDHSVVEFVVDTYSLSSKVIRTGNLNYADDDWNSSIVAIRVYNKRV